MPGKNKAFRTLVLACLTMGAMTGCRTQSVEYTFHLRDKLDQPLSGVKVSIGKKSGVTDDNGETTFQGAAGSRKVKFEGLETGYFLDEDFKTSSDQTEYDIQFNSKIIPGSEREKGVKYSLGDVFCDFTCLNIDQKTIQFSDLIEGKKGILLNFWGTQCVYCRYEFPYMQEAYEKYKDDFIIVSCDDGVYESASDKFTAMRNFWKQKGYTFPTVYCEAESKLFHITGYPTSYIIDRYGFIVKEEVGAMAMSEDDEPGIEKLFERIIADDYTPRLANSDGDFADPIDVEIPDPSTYAAIANGVDLTFTQYEGYWPWIYDDEKGAIKPSNTGHDCSYSYISMTFNIPTTKVLAFDYYLSSEAGDYFTAEVDHNLQFTLSGTENEWKTCYFFYPLVECDYMMTFGFSKDIYKGEGDDTVYLKNFRAIDLSDVTESFTIIRSAAAGVRDADTGSAAYYTTAVYNATDGYYHAGSESGPQILCDFFSETYWSQTKSYYGALSSIYSSSLSKKDIYNYLLKADSSSDGMTPVDADLYEDLQEAMTSAHGKFAASAIGLTFPAHNFEWLEVCNYYDTFTPGN